MKHGYAQMITNFYKVIEACHPARHVEADKRRLELVEGSEINQNQRIVIHPLDFAWGRLAQQDDSPVAVDFKISGKKRNGESTDKILIEHRWK